MYPVSCVPTTPETYCSLLTLSSLLFSSHLIIRRIPVFGYLVINRN